MPLVVSGKQYKIQHMGSHNFSRKRDTIYNIGDRVQSDRQYVSQRIFTSALHGLHFRHLSKIGGHWNLCGHAAYRIDHRRITTI